MALLLFDVDLTLIDTNGAGRRAMNLAFEKLFGVKNGMNKVDFAGRPDPAILRDALDQHKLIWVQSKEQNFKHTYFDYLSTEIKKPNPRRHIEPGILEILKKINNSKDIALGLLTGNWRQAARIKLEHFNLFHFFELGAFADDSDDRNDLPQFAVNRFSKKRGLEIPPEDVFIIGDTPLDIACAKSYGAKSIAVATGFFSYSELEKAQPDYLFSDLTNVNGFFDLVTI